jgi:rhamnosyltransferase
MTHRNIGVVAIVVTYHPDFNILSTLLNAIQLQVDGVVVVDNGSSISIEDWLADAYPDVAYLALGQNYGIAKAQNIGIAWAKNGHARHVLLLDQDSLPGSCMVENLLSGMRQKKDDGYKVAAVGPKYRDIKCQQASPFVKLKGRKLCRIDCNEDEVVAVDHLISSGCLISMDALADVGDMNEQLFIDYVDTEWCLRAIHKGYALFGVGSSHMRHDLGDKFTKLFGRTIFVHSPLRYYYIIRNGLWLLRQPWVSSAWRIMDARRLFKIYIVCSLFIGTRFENWKMMSKGMWHGLIGRMGKLHE